MEPKNYWTKMRILDLLDYHGNPKLLEHDGNPRFTGLQYKLNVLDYYAFDTK